jgi:serine/threonine protein kinase
VAAWKPNGRAADIFSSGCVLLEILILEEQGTLQHMRQHRSSDPSFHANLDRVAVWCTHERWRSGQWMHLLNEVQSILVHDPAQRPTAKQLLVRTTGYDLSTTIESEPSIFGECCKSLFIPKEKHEREASEYSSTIRGLLSDLDSAQAEGERMRRRILSLEYENKVTRIRE